MSDQVYERLAKLQEMRQHYRYVGNDHMLSQLESMIEQCMAEIDEENEIQYFDDFIGRNTGVVIDTEKKKVIDPDEKSKRKKRFGGAV